MESRVKKSITNAQVNLVFYLLTLLATFFSRKIFLSTLGDEFIGLTSTLQNLLGLFNLAELGISSAIAFSLYKPLYTDNHNEISDLISIFGYLYKKIGLFIACGGFLVSFLLPFFFKDTNINWILIYATYFVYLGISLWTYFFNYKQILITADQKEYYVTAYYQSANLIKILLQIGLLTKFKNPYIWLAIEFIFSIIYSIILNVKIKSLYPWLDSKTKDGKNKLKIHPEILKHTKQIFVHKLASITLLNTSPILVYSFSNLTLVTFYMNYNLITQKIDLLVTQLLNSTSAGIGNLIAEGNKQKILDVFEQLLAIRFIIATVFSLSIYYCINKFIILWLGEEYLLPKEIVIMIIVIFFLKQIGEVNDQFLRAHGLFYDTWAPITEALTNIIISILGGYFYGLNGVLLGPIFSMIIIVHIWKPFFLFTKGFKIAVWEYWKKILIFLINAIIVITTYDLIDSTYTKKLFCNNFSSFVIYAFIQTCTISIITMVIMYLTNKGTRALINRFIKQ